MTKKRKTRQDLENEDSSPTGEDVCGAPHSGRSYQLSASSLNLGERGKKETDKTQIEEVDCTIGFEM